MLDQRSQSLVPHTRPETPTSVTHNHDEDYSEEESDRQSGEGEEKPTS